MSAWDLNSFSWMQRGTVQDMMAFMAKTVSERTQPTQRQSIQENNFTAHVHARPAVDGISGVLVSDSEYPVRVAFSLLNKLLEEFLMKVPKSSWQAQAMDIASTGSIPSKGDGIVRTSDFPFAQDYLARYQDPRQADTILRVQQELDDTKIVLHNTIDSVLQRGEDLDKLVEKSGSLSQQSKMFYKSAKKVRMSVFMCGALRLFPCACILTIFSKVRCLLVHLLFKCILTPWCRFVLRFHVVLHDGCASTFFSTYVAPPSNPWEEMGDQLYFVWAIFIALASCAWYILTLFGQV